LLARLRVRRRLSLLLLLLLLLLLARLRFGSHLCSTPSSCDGVECVFAFPTGAARHRARRCIEMATVTSVTMGRVHANWRGAPAPRTLPLRLNRCRRARNGRCEDRASAGGQQQQQQQLPPTSSTECREGMDCSDRGVRTIRQPTGERSPRRRIAAWRRWVAPAVLSDVCLCTLMTADRVPSLHRLARSWGRVACGTQC
jgi:hypothetical protein